MSLQVKLYSFTGKPETINKLKGLSPIATKNADLYNNFDPQNPAFIFDALYNANLMTYQFGGTKYVAQISRTVKAEELYVYTGTIDALATAYENDCMDSSTLQVVSYSPVGNGELMADPRAPRLSVAYRDSGLLTPNNIFPGNWVLVNILVPDITYIPNMPNPGVFTYVMDANAWASFVTQFLSWSANDQQHYGNSILGVYCVNKDMLFAYGSGGNITNAVGGAGQTITLCSASTSWFDFNAGAVSTKQITLPNTSYCYVLRSIPRKTIHSSMSLTMTESLIDAHFTVYIQGVGALTFTPAEIGLSADITDIGALVAYDPVGGTIGAKLLINNAEYNNIFIRSPMTVMFPFYTDTSITNYASLAASAVLLVGGIIATASGVGAGAGVPAIMGAIGAAGGGAAGIVSGISSSLQGATGTRGGIGGAADYAENRPSFWAVQEHEYVDIVNFQQRYGIPDGRALALSYLFEPGHMPGYIQTSGAHLPVKNNLPISIIREAEGLLDAGAWII